MGYNKKYLLLVWYSDLKESFLVVFWGFLAFFVFGFFFFLPCVLLNLANLLCVDLPSCFKQLWKSWKICETMVFRHSEQAVQENNIPWEEWKNEGIFMIALAYF